jgi:hypothetical protein
MPAIGLNQFARNVQVLIAASPLYRAFCAVAGADDIWDEIEAIVVQQTAETVLTDEQERQLDELFDQLKIFYCIADDTAAGEVPPRAIVMKCAGTTSKRTSPRQWETEGNVEVCIQAYRDETKSRSVNLRRFDRTVEAIQDQMLHLSGQGRRVLLGQSVLTVPPWNVETQSGDDDALLEYAFEVAVDGGTV